LGTSGFPIQKRDIFYKIKEINGLRGDVLQYVAQVIPQIDDEIVKNSHLWIETRLVHCEIQGHEPSHTVAEEETFAILRHFLFCDSED
jgi:hypothetical protein